MQTVVLLTISNVFMTFAWYGHLKFKDSPLFTVILVSWGICVSACIVRDLLGADQSPARDIATSAHELHDGCPPRAGCRRAAPRHACRHRPGASHPSSRGAPDRCPAS